MGVVNRKPRYYPNGGPGGKVKPAPVRIRKDIPTDPVPPIDPVEEEDIGWECAECGTDFKTEEELDTHKCRKKPRKRKSKKKPKKED